MKKHKKSGFFLKLFIVLIIIGGILTGGYFAIDKLVVPKYFSNYGIHNMSELVGMMKTLYNSPKEKDFIVNGYTKIDAQSANKKLIDAAFPETSPGSGQIDYAAVAKGDLQMTKGEYEFTDREIAAILDDMVKGGVLTVKLPNLNYLNDIDMSVRELIVSPIVTENKDQDQVTTEAEISAVLKIDMINIRSKIAEMMDTPLFLLNMIIPEVMYVKINFTLAQDETNEWAIKAENMAINGRTAEQSEILANLLIDFIFPDDTEMTISRLTDICGDILLQGIGFLGDLSFEYKVNGANGILITV